MNAIDIATRTAIFTKFEDILNLVDVNRGVVLYPPEVAFRMISEKKGSSISEFINIWRTRTAPSWERQRTPVARRGIDIAFTDDNKTNIVNVKAMPVNLEYGVWFWTKDLDKINIIAERYLFWQHSNPNLNLYYNIEYPIELDMHFGEMIDESNVPSMLDRGNHFRMMVPIKIDGWVFASSDDNSVIKKIELVLYDSQNLSDYKKCIFETDEYDLDVEAALRLYEEHIFGITAVNIATNSFGVKDGGGDSNDDVVDEFIQGNYIYVDSSTGNDGRYTIVSSSDETDYTKVVVLETIEDDTVDGNISIKNL